MRTDRKFFWLAAAAAAAGSSRTKTTHAFVSPLQGRVPGYRDAGFSRLFSSPASLVEKVLSNPRWPPQWPYSDRDFARMDESDDAIFYDQPRLVHHIDDYAVKALTEYYGTCFRDGENVSDLCSSWVSHFPEDWKGGEKVVGLGMNAYELGRNPALTETVVRDLNRDPTFPFADGTFDKVACAVSVDYLNKPLEVFREIGRVLRPGGECILSMSNRCFPTKAFQIWLRTSDLEHVFIAGSFFHYAGLFDPPVSIDVSPYPGRSDPLFIVKAAKKAERKHV